MCVWIYNLLIINISKDYLALDIIESLQAPGTRMYIEIRVNLTKHFWGKIYVQFFYINLSQPLYSLLFGYGLKRGEKGGKKEMQKSICKAFLFSIPNIKMFQCHVL